MFCADNTHTTAIVDSLVQELNSLCVDVTTLDEEELKTYRLQLAKIKTLAGGLMAETSTKEHHYNTDEVKEYINQILIDGYNLKPTELSTNPKFKDAQKLKRFTTIIAECVEASPFSAKNFTVAHLQGLRKNIAASKTLHELRQAVKLMIEPLIYFLQQQDESDLIEELTNEVDSLTQIAEERKRVIDELVGCYDSDCQDIETLKLCEAAKKRHNLSDEQAAKVGGISRKKLLKLRADIELNGFMLEDVCN